MGELGSPPPTEQAVDREISLNAVDKEQYRKVSDWFDAHAHLKILFLELGVGLRNGVIKHMLAQIANACEHTTYTVLNYSQTMALDASCETILVDGDMAPAFAREPRAIRALCERARQWLRAVAGARRGRNDPWHHHAPVLEHDRKAAGCAPVERQHHGRLSPIAAQEQGRGDSGRFEHAALDGTDGQRCLSLLVGRFKVRVVVHRLQPLVGGLLARNLQREM